MEALNNTRRGATVAALAVSLSALIAGAAGAQTQNPAPQNPPAQNGPTTPGTNTGEGSANGPSSLNPGGLQGRQPGSGEAGQPGSQTTGTATGAAAQGNSATQGSTLPAAANGYRPAPGSSRVQVTSATSLSPIIARAQDMLRVAQSRQADAGAGARQSYKAAASSLRKMLSAAGYGSSASSSLPALGSRGTASRVNATLASFPVASEQITDDIRVLRSMARQGSRSGNGLSASDMQQVASLYATGAKEFFTGQLRDALFESPVTVSLRTGGSRVEGTSTAASSSTAAAVRSDRPNLPFPVTLQNGGDGGAAGGYVTPPPAAGDLAAPQGLTPGQAANGGYVTPPNVLAPPAVVAPAAPNYGGYLFGPSALILNGYGPASGFANQYPYIPFF